MDQCQWITVFVFLYQEIQPSQNSAVTGVRLVARGLVGVRVHAREILDKRGGAARPGAARRLSFREDFFRRKRGRVFQVVGGVGRLIAYSNRGRIRAGQGFGRNRTASRISDLVLILPIYRSVTIFILTSNKCSIHLSRLEYMPHGMPINKCNVQLQSILIDIYLYNDERFSKTHVLRKAVQNRCEGA